MDDGRSNARSRMHKKSQLTKERFQRLTFHCFGIASRTDSIQAVGGLRREPGRWWRPSHYWMCRGSQQSGEPNSAACIRDKCCSSNPAARRPCTYSKSSVMRSDEIRGARAMAIGIWKWPTTRCTLVCTHGKAAQLTYMLLAAK
mgnify:FL=1